MARPRDLDDLIKECLADGIISGKERAVLLRKAEQMGIDLDEMDIYINAQQQKVDQKAEIDISKRRGQTCPYCGGSIPELTDKCPHCGQHIAAAASRKLEDTIEKLETALAKFSSPKFSWNVFETSQAQKQAEAELERYLRQAKMYYGENPKIKQLIKEVEEIVHPGKGIMKYFLLWFLFSCLVLLLLGVLFKVGDLMWP